MLMWNWWSLHGAQCQWEVRQTGQSTPEQQMHQLSLIWTTLQLWQRAKQILFGFCSIFCIITGWLVIKFGKLKKCKQSSKSAEFTCAWSLWTYMQFFTIFSLLMDIFFLQCVKLQVVSLKEDTSDKANSWELLWRSRWVRTAEDKN